MKRIKRTIRCVGFACFVTATNAAISNDAFFYTDNLSTLSQLTPVVFVDARSSADCRQKTLADAICLAPAQLIWPDGTLSSMRDINWLFGALGIDENATTVVFGHESIDADAHFVASLIYLLGQYKVSIWSGDTAPLFEHQNTVGGTGPGVLRKHFYQAAMRDKHLLLDSDVRQFFSTTSVERFSLTAIPDSEVYSSADGARLVLASTAREALTGFARLLATSTDIDPNRLFVHISGMGDRVAADFGAPERFSRSIIIVVFAVVSLIALIGVFLIRFKRNHQ